MNSAISEVRWIRLDADKVQTKGDFVAAPDLSKVDEIGFADLTPGSGHGAGGWVDVGEIDVYGKGRPPDLIGSVFDTGVAATEPRPNLALTHAAPQTRPESAACSRMAARLPLPNRDRKEAADRAPTSQTRSESADAHAWRPASATEPRPNLSLTHQARYIKVELAAIGSPPLIVLGRGLDQGCLSDAEIHSICAAGLAQLPLDDARVLVLIPDGTRTMPMPRLFGILETELSARVRTLWTFWSPWARTSP